MTQELHKRLVMYGSYDKKKGKGMAQKLVKNDSFNEQGNQELHKRLVKHSLYNQETKGI